jgi:ubiquitin-conjugating enzyme E2 G1|tara:strand:- start:13846 stop:13992 length:147 start_codon:yes stop_codon:yes gene_type:complete
MSDQAVLLLRKQLKELSRNPIEGFSAGLVDDTNVFEWQITVMGPPDTM